MLVDRETVICGPGTSGGVLGIGEWAMIPLLSVLSKGPTSAWQRGPDIGSGKRATRRRRADLDFLL